MSVTASAPAGGEEGEQITLAASVQNADGAVAYSWTQTAGPAALIDNADTAMASLQIPLVSAAADLTLEVEATDAGGNTSTAATTVSATPAPFSDVVEIETVHDGARRIYSVYTPANPIVDAPLIVFLHGAGGNMRDIVAPGQTPRRWFDLAEANGFVILVPNGFSNQDADGLGDDQSWNDLGDAFSNADDVGFILRAVDEVAAGRTIDAERVFVNGVSNGGMMSMRLAIEAPREFRAVASFVGNLARDPIPAPPSLPTPPIMLFNGTEDPIVAFDGSATLRSAAATVDYFADNTLSDLSATPPFVMLDDVVADDGCQIFSQSYSDFMGAPSVTYYEGRGGGHYIPDPDLVQSPQNIIARGPVICRDANGVDLAFAFFENFF